MGVIAYIDKNYRRYIACERYQDVIRRKEVSDLEKKFDARVRNIEVYVLELQEHGRLIGAEDPLDEELQQGETEAEKFLNSNKPIAAMLTACYGIVNRMYKKEWKKHVAKEVKWLVQK